MGKGDGIIGTEVIEQITKVAIVAYRSQLEKEKNRYVTETKKLLRAYRMVKRGIEEEVLTQEEQTELRWAFMQDLVEQPPHTGRPPDRRITEIEMERQENRLKLHRIDTAIRLYEEDCQKTDAEENKRRLRVLKAMYIDEEESTLQAIAEAEKINERTVYKDIEVAARMIAVYMYGFGAII